EVDAQLSGLEIEPLIHALVEQALRPWCAVGLALQPHHGEVVLPGAVAALDVVDICPAREFSSLQEQDLNPVGLVRWTPRFHHQPEAPYGPRPLPAGMSREHDFLAELDPKAQPGIHVPAIKQQ